MITVRMHLFKSCLGRLSLLWLPFWAYSALLVYIGLHRTTTMEKHQARIETNQKGVRDRVTTEVGLKSASKLRDSSVSKERAQNIFGNVPVDSLDGACNDASTEDLLEDGDGLRASTMDEATMQTKQLQHAFELSQLRFIIYKFFNIGERVPTTRV